MATAEVPKKSRVDADALRNEWLARLEDLVSCAEGWAQEIDWSTRRIQVKITDSQLGEYRAPALLLQKVTTRAFLDPISHSTPGSEGIVDLYIMPAYDDVARLYFRRGRWNLIYALQETPSQAKTPKEKARTLTKKVFQWILAEMTKHDPRAVQED
jgi:hypothetical protein